MAIHLITAAGGRFDALPEEQRLEVSRALWLMQCTWANQHMIDWDIKNKAFSEAVAAWLVARGVTAALYRASWASGGTYVCPICHRTRSTQHMARHLALHEEHGSDWEPCEPVDHKIEAEQMLLIPSDRVWLCGACDKAISEAAHCRRHMKTCKGTLLGKMRIKFPGKRVGALPVGRPAQAGTKRKSKRAAAEAEESESEED